MNSFVTLRDIDMFSKRNMFKINPTSPQEYFHVRAGECARYIFHRPSKVVKKSTFSIVFKGSDIMYIFVVSKNINMFFQNKSCSKSRIHLTKKYLKWARSNARAIFYMIFSITLKKTSFLSYFPGLFCEIYVF